MTKKSDFMNRFRFIGKHFWLHSLVLLLLGVLPFGCSDARKVPDQSVFEPLNARQMKRALKAPLFDDFYSRYSRKINKCKDAEKYCFADITWRSMYEYDSAIHYRGKNGKKIRAYLNEREDFWYKRYGQFDSKVDSIIVQNVDSLKNYFKQFISIEFVKSERKALDLGLYDFRSGINVYYVFRMTPVSCPVSKCQFRLFKADAYNRFDNDSLHFTLNTELATSAIYTWRRCYISNIFGFNNLSPSDDYLQECEIVLTEVCLPNGEKYSISDLALPKSVNDYYLGDVSQNEARSGLFDEILGYPYVGSSDYMEHLSHAWLRYKFPRETAFVKALRENY